MITYERKTCSYFLLHHYPIFEYFLMLPYLMLFITRGNPQPPFSPRTKHQL
jgi:hypothetical protein